MIYCDACKDMTDHVLIKTGNNVKLYQCRACGSVVEIPEEKEIKVRAIISSGANSERGILTLKLDEVLRVGDEKIVEVNEGFKIGEITSLEFKNGARVDSAKAEEVSTVWLRDTGEVFVKISLHKGLITTPYKMLVSGDTEFSVGELLEINRRDFKITRIKLINGRVLKKEGDTAEAKKIRRIYAMYQRRYGRRRFGSRSGKFGRAGGRLKSGRSYKNKKSWK